MHLLLSRIYLTIGSREQATYELQLAQTTSGAQPTNVLGETTSELANELQFGPEAVRKQKIFWEEVVRKNPTYRDAWIQLYYIALNLNDSAKAQEYLGKVKQLDPNYTISFPSSIK